MAGQGLRSHLSGSVPVSIVVHLVALLVLVVIPLASNVIAPIPVIGTRGYLLAAPLPPPPAVIVRSAAPPTAPRSPDSAPTHAPDTITPEPPPSVPFTPMNAADTGLPPGFGVDGGGVVMTSPQPPPAPEPAKPSGPVRVAELPEQPHKVIDVRPIYPDLARAAHVEGTVILEAVLDTTGHVTQLRVLRSVPLLDQAALDAVRQWRYSPSIYYGKPVSVLMTITVRFTLQQ
jgi:protein TonB